LEWAQTDPICDIIQSGTREKEGLEHPKTHQAMSTQPRRCWRPERDQRPQQEQSTGQGGPRADVPANEVKPSEP